MRRILLAGGALVWGVFGWFILQAGLGVLGRWSSIGAAFAAVGIVWLVAGAAMMGAALWSLASLARRAAPLWIGGSAAVLAGGVLVAGVLSSVVPCSGPS